jgi:hypothetical protein
MPELPGAEFVPLEPPVTPRTPREEAASAAKSTPGQRRLSPHFEQAAESVILSPGTRLTPGPMREWIFRDDEVSTDTRSSTTEQTSEAFSGMNSQDEESEGNRVALCPRLNLTNAMQSGAKGPASRASPSRKSPRSSLGAVGLQLRGIEVVERVCARATRDEMHVCYCVRQWQLQQHVFIAGDACGRILVSALLTWRSQRLSALLSDPSSPLPLPLPLPLPAPNLPRQLSHRSNTEPSTHLSRRSLPSISSTRHTPRLDDGRQVGVRGEVGVRYLARGASASARAYISGIT